MSEAGEIFDPNADLPKAVSQSVETAPIYEGPNPDKPKLTIDDPVIDKGTELSGWGDYRINPEGGGRHYDKAKD